MLKMKLLILKQNYYNTYHPDPILIKKYISVYNIDLNEISSFINNLI